MEFKQYKTTYAGRELTIETGKYCGQTNGSCVVRCGDTVVMVSATMSKQPREGMDFFPLSVEFEKSNMRRVKTRPMIFGARASQ